jgi:hypothetical protein
MGRHDASRSALVVNASDYDKVGSTYVATRRPDPRLAAALREALGDVTSVVNIGAGSGAYEPTDLDVVAVEPSRVMIGQRPAGAAPARAWHETARPRRAPPRPRERKLGFR